MKRYMISLCDLTGNACKPWADFGYDTYSIDIQHSIRNPRTESFGKGTITYQWGDIRSWTPPSDGKICFVAAFPPCTHFSSSGARDFLTKGLRMLTDSFDLFNSCYVVASWSGAPFFVENPVGVVSTHFRKPDYSFDPYEYGGYKGGQSDCYSKKTNLWVGNGFIMPKTKPVKLTMGSKMHKLPPSKERTNLRSATPMGFAQAIFEANKDVVK